MAAKKKGLGRGLEALLGLDSGPDKHESDAAGELRQIAVGRIQPGRYQPRTGMDPDRLSELADSIRAQGLIQPIVVRAIAPDKSSRDKAGQEKYEIIAGERRWRAAQLAELTEVPCVVREVDDHATLAMALIENIQREDLNPLEEATALKRLIEEFHLTHQQAAEAVGRSRAAVSNLLRLLELPVPIKTLLEEHKLEMGHARALLTLEPASALELARQAAQSEWTVRELEERARRLHEIDEPAAAKHARGARRGARAPSAPDPNITQLETELAEKLGAKVAIAHGKGGRGKLTIEYFSVDELEGILERIR